MPGNEREASVKVTLNTGGYLSALKETTRANESAGRQWGRALKGPTIAGLKEVGREIASTASRAKEMAKFGLTLGGAFTFGGAIKGAVAAQSQFKNLAFSIRSGTGAGADWRALMDEAQGTAVEFGETTQNVGNVVGALYKEIGDIGAARQFARSVVQASTASGESLEALTTIAGTLGEKFGVTGSEIDDAMAIALGAANSGGATIDDLAGIIGGLGASAKELGVQGPEGFRRMLAMANIADGTIKNMRKTMASVSGLAESFANRDFGKKVQKELGINIKGKGLDAGMKEILRKTGGKEEELSKIFEGDVLKLVVEIGRNYSSTFASTAGTIKQKGEAAAASFDEQLRKAGESAVTAAQVQKDAAVRAEDPQRRLTSALQRMERSFASPKMIDAIDKLTAKLPELTEKVSGFINFVLDNPKTTAGIVAGMKLGAPFLSGALQAAAPSVGKAILSALSSKGMAGAFVPSGGGAPGMLAKGAGFASSALAVAGAGVAGFELGDALATHVVDPMVNESRGKAVSLEMATKTADINTSGRFSKQGAESSLANLRASLDTAKQDREFSWKDVATLGLRRLGTASEGDVNKGEELYAQRRAAADAMAPAATQTADALKATADVVKDVNSGLRDLARNLANAGTVRGGASGGPPARGPMPVSPAKAGYLPRG
jgi:hypothetical protein